MTKLSEHFTLEELVYSDTAKKYGVSNNPTEIHLKTLKHTCEYGLEILRFLLNQKYAKQILYGKKIKNVILNITSGYRSNTVNKLLEKEGYHPSRTSQHCNGEAVDLEAFLVFEDGSKRALSYQTTYGLIKQWVKEGKLSVDQCLQEKQGKSTWVHFSYKAGGASVNRKDFKTTTDGIHFVVDKL